MYVFGKKVFILLSMSLYLLFVNVWKTFSAVLYRYHMYTWHIYTLYMYTLHMYTCTHVHLYTCILFTHCTILSVNHLRPFNLISKFITTFVKSPYNAHTPVSISISISVFRYSLSWSIIPSRYNSVIIPLYFRYISVIIPLQFPLFKLLLFLGR